MTCPSCQETLKERINRCPHCGVRIMRMEAGVIKTSAILIASDDVQAMFPSLQDVPEPLRKRLVACTSGKNSGTIVIADRRGKEEIERSARVDRQPACPDIPSARNITWQRLWPALIALVIGVAGAWVAFAIH